MKLLFFDMEFADGRVPGSIYSLGYLVTDENFEILTPSTDLLIDPDSTWNAYVEENILAYPKEMLESAPKFPMHYDFLKTLFGEIDVAVGFAVNNDTRALNQDCKRYGLEPLHFRYFDTERLCRKLEEHKDARGLAGCVRAWCGEEPDHQHRSDGDALATMMLLRAICRAKHVTPEMLLEAYPECAGDSVQKTRKKAKQVGKKAGTHRRPRRRKKPQPSRIRSDEAPAQS